MQTCTIHLTASENEETLHSFQLSFKSCQFHRVGNAIQCAFGAPPFLYGMEPRGQGKDKQLVHRQLLRNRVHFSLKESWELNKMDLNSSTANSQTFTSPTRTALTHSHIPRACLREASTRDSEVNALRNMKIWEILKRRQFYQGMEDWNTSFSPLPEGETTN